MHVAASQVRAEQRVFWRNRASAFFTFLLPILFLALFGLIGSDAEVDGTPYAEFFVPGMLCMAVVVTTFAGLAITLTIRRDNGVLKRVRGTPLPLSVYLGALVASMAIVLAAESAIVLLLGRFAFDVEIPGSLAGLVAVSALGAACFAAMGIATSRFVPHADGSSAVVNAIYLPMLLLSGVFFPVSELPQALQAVAEVLPLTHLMDALRDVFAGRGLHGESAAGLLVTVAWGVAAAILAARTFTWEPQGP